MSLGGFVGPSASPWGRLGSRVGLLEAPRGPRWGLKGTQKRSFENSGCHREPAKTPKERPRSPQEHPKRAQESPKTPSRASLKYKPWFFINRAAVEAKSRFLRVGRSAWKLKIDTKRLQDEENKDFEEGSERRNENKKTMNSTRNLSWKLRFLWKIGV